MRWISTLMPFCDSTSVAAFSSFVLPHAWGMDDANLFIQWLITGIKSKSGCDFVVSTILWKQHWIPLVFSHAGIGITAHTSPEGQSLLESLLAQASTSSPLNLIQARPVIEVFPADCGFQCIGWICAIATAGDIAGDSTFTPVNPSTGNCSVNISSFPTVSLPS